jgi:hypothetical protein
MAQAWYEKINGSNKSGQIVSTEQLLSELRRLDCRFRTRGSHITFAHDEAGVRGTIVYGSKKLWSQKTVAQALVNIKAQTGSQVVIAEAEHEAEPDNSNIKKIFHATSAPAMTIPAQFTSEFHQGNAAQVIVRDRDYPQIGTMVTPYNSAEITARAFQELAVKKSEFEDSLNFLEQDGDFKIIRDGDVMHIAHPVFGIEAILSPYDPDEMQEPNEILSNCLSTLAPYADNQNILASVLKSRKLELLTSTEKEDGSVQQTYVSRRFQRSFGVRVSLETTKSGHVTDKALTGFLDDVDKQFFDGIPHFMKHSYGYELEHNRSDFLVKAKHPLLKELSFTFPNFDHLPKLRDIYAKREEIGENAYVEQINDVLKQRDDILELVSYGLIFSVEQMMDSSNEFFDMIDEYEKMKMAGKKLRAEREEKIAAGEIENVPELSEEEQEKIDRLRKSTSKKIKKMEGEVRSEVKALYDASESAKMDGVSYMKNQKLPENYPYGRVMTRNVDTSDNTTAIKDFKYMVLKNPDGSNLVVFSEDSMKAIKEMVMNARKNLPDVTAHEYESDISNLRKVREAALSGMTPEAPALS